MVFVPGIPATEGNKISIDCQRPQSETVRNVLVHEHSQEYSYLVTFPENQHNAAHFRALSGDEKRYNNDGFINHGLHVLPISNQYLQD